MCGIAGAYSFRGGIHPHVIRRMTASLRHRGPDDEGFLAVDSTSRNAVNLIGTDSKTYGTRIEDFSGSANLFIGHRRLSVIDLSPKGHQPMSNEDKSLWVVHNGEVYNYVEIKRQLEALGHHFNSQTDTEVILHAYEEWGIECLHRFNGMWAFAIVDLRGNRIFCSRDRAGIKPFYYFYDTKHFYFASEIKALLRMENFSIEPNEQIVADYLFSGLIDHTKETFFKHIHQLRPGEYLLLGDNQMSVKSYWDIDCKEIRFAKENQYYEHFYELFSDSIGLRLRSDVPIGTCLSGGLDSSSIVCVANNLMFKDRKIDPRLVGERQKTFSSCFEDSTYDERKFIELVTGWTGAEKNYVFPKGESLFKDLARLIWHQEEPFGSTSIYAQWKVMQLAKERQVTVLLDGQGGDELLGGYLPCFYFALLRALKRMDVRSFIRETKGFWQNHKSISHLIPGLIERLVSNRLKPFVPQLDEYRTGWADGGFRKRYFRAFPTPVKFALDLDDYLYAIFRSTVLPGLLHYEDRNSMAFSLETRLPFLDYRLVEFMFALPTEYKVQDGMAKVILRRSMRGILPEDIINRVDKMGFVTPEEVWFRTVLRKDIHEIISSKSFAQRGYFDAPKVRKTFDEYCSGRTNLPLPLWRWVNLELWLRAFVDQDPYSEICKEDGDR